MFMVQGFQLRTLNQEPRIKDGAAMQHALLQHTIPLIPALYDARPWLTPEISATIPRVVKTRMLQPERLTISQWAEKYRRVTEIDAVPGPWRNDIVPHAVKIMDTIGQPNVREAWICAVERSAKTQIVLNTCLWTIDRSAQSGNIFWLMPTEHDARKALGDRIIPVLRATDRTAKYLDKSADATTRGGITFTNGLTLRPAWSNSPGSMASYFGRLNIADEVDKFPDRTSEGTDPITLFLKRSRDDRHRSKYLFVSTPAGRYIYKGMLSCEQIWEYRMKCPDCGDAIAMDIEHLIIPTGTTPETCNRADIHYSCNSCGTLWDEYRREMAYETGHWHATKGAELRHPSTVGFHFPALPCPKVSYAEIAAAYLRSQIGGIQEKSAWANGYEAIDYEAEATSTVTTEHLLQYKSDLPRNLVPTDNWQLVLLVDTQQSSFYYQIWSIGHAPEMRLHMVRHGILEKFLDLEGLLQEEFTDANNTIHRIHTGMIDSGGTRRGWQKHSRTVEVYEWCSRHRNMRPLKGMHGRQGDTVTYKEIELFPGTNKKVPGGIKRANIRVDLFKDELERRLQIQPDDRGALSFHDGIDEDFAKHYTAECKDEHGDWQHNRKHRNDYWDCTVYAVALFEILKLRIPQKNAAPATRRIMSRGINA
jgi:phage terminase large subunit GpA-like protein